MAEGGEFDLEWPARGAEGDDAPESMAPEQRLGGRVTHRADVYRFGLLLWSLLSGQRPRGDGSRPPALASLRPDLPADLAAAIDAALEPEAARRTITCVELEQWIEPMDRGDEGRRLLEGALRLIAEEALPDAPEEDLSDLPESDVPESDVPDDEPPPPSPEAPLPAPMARVDPGSRRLWPLQSIGVAALTAALVFALGTYLGDHALRGVFW